MSRWPSFAGVLVAALAFVPSALAVGSEGTLDMYRATVDGARVAELTRDGYDVAAVRQSDAGTQVDLVLPPTSQRDALRTRGIRLGLITDQGRQTVRQQAAPMAVGGFTVWRSYDEPGGIRDELYAIARKHPRHRQARRDRPHAPGARDHRAQGDQGARNQTGRQAPGGPLQARPSTPASGSRPRSTRRLLHHFVDNYATRRGVAKLLNTRELWFLPVANPDGYQYTFDHERLWRKNLRDNDGDGEITAGDGVDLNRNYPEHWNYDDEGSSAQLASDTYRGPAPASEPETQAACRPGRRIDPKFAVNYHSYGPLLLYPQGWQVQTPTADDPIYIALSGTDANPAVAGFDPDVGADALHDQR